MSIVAQLLEGIGGLNVVDWDAVEETMQQRIRAAIAPPSPPAPTSTPTPDSADHNSTDFGSTAFGSTDSGSTNSDSTNSVSLTDVSLADRSPATVHANSSTASAACLVYPQTLEQLAAVISLAHQHRWRVLPCGSGTKLPWGGLAEDITLTVSTAKLNRLVDHAAGDLTVTAEAGMRLADLQAILAKQGQFLPLDPSYAAEATLGGIIATADSGALRHRYGGVRDLLIGMQVVRADGQVANAGGRVVKNVAGYDLMKLFTGSWGTLGILSQVTFRVYPLPEASQTLVLAGDAQAIAHATQTLLSSALTPTAVELVIAPALPFLKRDGIALLVRFQGISVGVATQVQQFSEVGQALGLAIAQADETAWQHLQELGEQKLGETEASAHHNPVVTCKIGVTPSRAVTVLESLTAIVPNLELAQVHAGSGLGRLRFLATGAVLLQVRQLCETEGGFLTVLEAPYRLKQQVDVWGYRGNAIALMRGLKQQFDPTNLLSPSRFVDGI